jgi:predicted DNA-binding protein
MYSPKIKDELIPKIYQISKAKGMRMTTLVNEILKKALEKMEDKKNGWNDKSNMKGETYE